MRVYREINNDYDDEYIKEYDILRKFKSNNILNEKIELYKDFTLNLSYKIYETYLGTEYIDNMEKATGHFNWCFRKILDEFHEQEIDFYLNNSIYNYFFNFFIVKFYKQKEQPKLDDVIKRWENIFNYRKKNKTKKEFDEFTELYEIFDESLNSFVLENNLSEEKKN